MKSALLLLSLFLSGSLLAEDRQVTFEQRSDDARPWKWIPVILTEAERKLLESRSDPPRTALDFYLLLGRKYFSNVANDLERRITFIEMETLSATYLKANYTIPSVDAGAFWVTIRLFGDEKDKLIAISHGRGNKRLYVAKEGGTQGLWSISVNRPEFWRYRGEAFSDGGALLREPDSLLPELAVESVLERYRNHYKAHLNHAGQKKSIYLTYELPPQGLRVEVTGRENFMSPRKRYVWGAYVFRDRKFASVESSKPGEGESFE